MTMEEIDTGILWQRIADATAIATGAVQKAADVSAALELLTNRVEALERPVPRAEKLHSHHPGYVPGHQKQLDHLALEEIRMLLSETHWGVATCPAIADIVRGTGRTIRDPEGDA